MLTYMVFCPLLKISFVNPYLKILDLAKLFVANAPIEKNNTKKSFTSSQITLKYGSKNRPWFEGLKTNCPIICLTNKLFWQRKKNRKRNDSLNF